MKIDYKSQILDVISDYVSGLTIRDISTRINVHRNTVSKYLNIMEVEGSVTKKKVGSALLYVSSKRKHIRKEVFKSFIKSFFSSLKQELPKSQDAMKNVGRLITDTFEFPIKEEYLDEMISMDLNDQIKKFQEFYNSFDFIQEDVDISIMELTKNQGILKFKNSEFLETTENYILYFSMVVGIIEGMFWKYFKKKISCDILNVKLSTKKNESFIEIIIKKQ